MDEHQDIKSLDTGYYSTDVDDLLLNGLAAKRLRNEADITTDEIVFLPLSPRTGTTQKKLAELPRPVVLVCSTICPADDILASTQLGNFVKQIKEAQLDFVAVPIQMEGGHLIAFVLIREKGYYKIISFNSEGAFDPERTEAGSIERVEASKRDSTWQKFVGAVTTALGSEQNYIHYSSHESLERPGDKSCGPRMVAFLCEVLANPWLFRSEQFDLGKYTTLMRSWDESDIRALHAGSLDGEVGLLKARHSIEPESPQAMRLFTRPFPAP